MDSFEPKRDFDEQNTQNPNTTPHEPMFQRSATGSYNDAGASLGANGYNQPEAQPKYFAMFDPERIARWRSVFKLGNTVGLPLCLYFVGAFVLILFIKSIMLAMFGVDESNALLSDPNVVLLVNAVLNLCLFTVPFIFAVSMTEYKIGTLISFKSKLKSPNLLALTMMGIGVCSVGNFGTHFLSEVLESIAKHFGKGFEVPSSSVQYGTGTASLLIALLCIGILPALLEEFAFRGVILGLLRTKLSDGTSIVISAALFGMVHGNLQQMPFAFIVGLVLGYSVVSNGSMLAAILIHATNNIITVVSQYTTIGVGPLEGQLFDFLIQIVMLLLGICGFIMLIKTDKNALKLSKENTKSVGRDVLTFVCTPWVLGYIGFVTFSVLESLGIVTA